MLKPRSENDTAKENEDKAGQVSVSGTVHGCHSDGHLYKKNHVQKCISWPKGLQSTYLIMPLEIEAL